MSVNPLSTAYLAAGRTADSGSRHDPERSLAIALAHALASVPYYRERYAALHVDPGMSFAALQMIEPVAKTDIQRQWDAFLSDSFRQDDLLVETTSGSTGQPLKCAKTPAERIAIMMPTWRWRQSWHPSITREPVASFHGERSLDGHPIRRPTVVDRGAVHFFSPFERSPRQLVRMLRAMAETGVTSILGWTSILLPLARESARDPSLLSGTSLRYIENQGEHLAPSSRQQIESAFGCRVADHYACRETYSLGRQCSVGGNLHVATDNVMLEVVSHHSPVPFGSVGEILVTSLKQRAMPLVRYRIGDRGALDPRSCECGMPGPLLRLDGTRVGSDIVGRRKRLSSIAIDWVVREVISAGYSIRQYRFVQTGPQMFHAIVCPARTDEDALRHLLESLLARLLADTITVTLQCVAHIDPLPSGKSPGFLRAYKLESDHSSPQDESLS